MTNLPGHLDWLADRLTEFHLRVAGGCSESHRDDALAVLGLVTRDRAASQGVSSALNPAPESQHTGAGAIDSPSPSLGGWEPEDGRAAVAVLIRDVIGEDETRPGLHDTPRRVVEALRELTIGYQQDPAKYLGVTFPDTTDQMVVLAGIRVVSLCEHHLLPFIGTAAVGYLPNGRVVGLSKLARVVNAYARRLQVQERLTEQIAEAIQEHLQPLGVGVLIRAHHSCMGLRGAMQHDAMMSTSALRGVLLSKPEARAEFLDLVRNG